MSEEVTTEETTTEEVVETPVEESNTQPESFVGSMLSQIEDESVKEAGFWKNLEGKDATEVGKYIKELQSFAGKKGDIIEPIGKGSKIFREFFGGDLIPFIIVFLYLIALSSRCSRFCSVFLVVLVCLVFLVFFVFQYFSTIRF